LTHLYVVEVVREKKTVVTKGQDKKNSLSYRPWSDLFIGRHQVTLKIIENFKIIVNIQDN